MSTEPNDSHYIRSISNFILYWGTAIAELAMANTVNSTNMLQQAITWSIQPGFAGPLSLALPVVSLLFASVNRPARATELFALANRELAGWTGWLEKWDLFVQLRSALEANLGSYQFAEAWERGQHLDLWDSAETLLTELKTIEFLEETKLE